jgi:uncharacterized repeat protein (TIGR02543 family)
MSRPEHEHSEKMTAHSKMAKRAFIIAAAVVLCAVAVCVIDGQEEMCDGATYTVSYNINGGNGTAPDAQTQSADGAPIDLDNGSGLTGPSSSSFVGWGTSSTSANTVSSTYTPTGNITLYAIWQHTVTYNNGGGTGTMTNSNVIRGQDLTLKDNMFTAPAGKEFAGWSKASGGSAKITKLDNVTSNMTVYATWKAIVYTITFDSNGGSGSQSSVSVEYGKTVTLPSGSNVTVKLSDCSFAFWADSKTGRDAVKTTPEVHGNVTYYAVWQCSVNFSGAYGSVEDKTVFRGDTVSGPENATRAGYIFGGWYADKDHTTAFDFTKPIDANTTIYAKWSQDMTYPTVAIAEIAIAALAMVGLLVILRRRA